MKNKLFVPLLACLLLLTGCSGLKNIQDLTYIAAIGMDYDEEKKMFKVYLQGLNFANVAKQEGGRSVEHIPIFIATATGETLNLAVRKLYKKSEPPLFFGHVSTLVLSNTLVEHHFKEVIQEIGRNRSLRQTIRVMTTDEGIQDIFNVKALFNYPAIYTVLYKKNANEVFQDEIKPTNLMDFLREYYEPMGSAKLPVVKIDSDSWKADKNYPVLFFSGYTIFQKQKFKGQLTFKDSVIIDWLTHKKISLNRKVEDNGKLVAAVKLASPKMKVKFEKGSDTPRFSIEVAVQADLLEKIKDVELKKLKKLIEDEIKTRIQAIYQQGVENQVDVLNTGDDWYRKHPKKYHELLKTNSFYLQKDSLKDVKVKVEIFHFNGYNYEKKGDGGY
ncbi:Ger(x)C family spore germination protein [Peribacillus alkalitolerans]|uniref:Ger(x)C family spore germination protein n=1 Tax=Peribacillus alkalitolerans TaxID=1550385 RepID=UPI0013D7D78B|nr:Ger(x)C family spore germination protein [Peribacillus alkalitolerans]